MMLTTVSAMGILLLNWLLEDKLNSAILEHNKVAVRVQLKSSAIRIEQRNICLIRGPPASSQMTTNFKNL